MLQMQPSPCFCWRHAEAKRVWHRRRWRRRLRESIDIHIHEITQLKVVLKFKMGA